MNTTGEVAKLYGVSDSTIRKWCLSLERNGYVFFTDQKDKLEVRYFSKSDLMIFQALQTLLNENKGKKLDDLTAQIVERFGKGYGSPELPQEPLETGLMPVVMQPFANEIQLLRSENTALRAELDAIKLEIRESRAEVGAAIEQNANELQGKLDQFKDAIITEITKSRAETHGKKKGFIARIFGL